MWNLREAWSRSPLCRHTGAFGALLSCLYCDPRQHVLPVTFPNGELTIAFLAEQARGQAEAPCAAADFAPIA